MAAKMNIENRATELADFFKQLRNDYTTGTMPREKADSLANIGGKELKAIAQVWAERMSQHQIEKYADYTAALARNPDKPKRLPALDG